MKKKNEMKEARACACEQHSECIKICTDGDEYTNYYVSIRKSSASTFYTQTFDFYGLIRTGGVCTLYTQHSMLRAYIEQFAGRICVSCVCVLNNALIKFLLKSKTYKNGKNEEKKKRKLKTACGNVFSGMNVQSVNIQYSVRSHTL